MTENENNSPESREGLRDTAAKETERPDQNVALPVEETRPMEDTPKTGTIDLANPQPPTEHMEVHHHTHTPRQKWTHYVWEFFMLFLAVTAAFIAENLREHYIEDRRAKQYAAFLYNDLREDTANLKSRTAFMAEGSKALDTLMAILQSFNDDEAAAAKIYALSAYVYSGVFFSATTSTLEQLKSSGSLRYFRSNDLIRNFSRYDTDLHRLKAVEDRNVYLNEEIRIFLAQFLDLKSIPRITFDTAAGASGFQLSQPIISKPPALYKKEREQREKFANLCALKQIDWNTRIRLQTRLLASARNLIAALKKEYNLK